MLRRRPLRNVNVNFFEYTAEYISPFPYILVCISSPPSHLKLLGDLASRIDTVWTCLFWMDMCCSGIKFWPG